MNWQASFKTPDHVRQEWANEHGLKAVASERYTAALDAVCTRLGVSTGDSLITSASGQAKTWVKQDICSQPMSQDVAACLHTYEGHGKVLLDCTGCKTVQAGIRFLSSRSRRCSCRYLSLIECEVHI